MAVRQVEQARGSADGPNHGGAPVLWHLKVSHYNEKVRWALDYKRVPHLRRAETPAPSRDRASAHRWGRSPYWCSTAQAIGDSSRIIEALERRHPEPPLYPADPGRASRALAIEDFFDEELGPYTRRLVLHTMLPDRELTARAPSPRTSPARRGSCHARRSHWCAAGDLGIRPRPRGHRCRRAKLRAAGGALSQRAPPQRLSRRRPLHRRRSHAGALLAPLVAPEQFPYPQPQRRHPRFAEVRAVLTEEGLAEWAREMYARIVAIPRRSHNRQSASGGSSGERGCRIQCPPAAAPILPLLP